MFDGCFFFFSSRRRHTRCSRDWSSDVCSSDLSPPPRIPRLACYRLMPSRSGGSLPPPPGSRPARGPPRSQRQRGHGRTSKKIGREAGRGRGEIFVGGGSLKKKKKNTT